MQIDWSAISVIMSSFAIVGTLVGVFINARKAPSEIREIESKAVNAVAQSVATLLAPLNERIDCLEAEKDKMDTTIKTMEKEKLDMDETIKNMKKENVEIKGTIDKVKAENTKMTKTIQSMEKRISELEKERDTIKREKEHVVVGAHKLVRQLKSISPDTQPVYMPPEG